MKRKIIKINEELCTGCGNCVTDCVENALQIVNGKAKLVRENLCDGMGLCIGSCPTGALSLEEVEVSPNPPAEPTGVRGSTLPLTNGAEHPGHSVSSGGCPGSRVLNLFAVNGESVTPSNSNNQSETTSSLNQWPIQLHLVPPTAPFFEGRELVVVSTCSPLAYPGINQRFVRHRAVVLACPKLDRQDGYLEKLTAILSNPSIPKVIVTRMEVPCCSGLTTLVNTAASHSGRSDLVVEEVIIGLRGQILNVRSWLAQPNEAKIINNSNLEEKSYVL